MIEFMTRQRSALTALYPVLAILVLQRFAESVISITPMRLDDVSWRFGASGVLINAVPSLAFALVLTMLLATLLDHRQTNRWLGILSIVIAAGLAATVLSFGLDALTVRRMIREDAKPGFDDAALKALVIAVLFVPTLFWAGWQAVRSAKGAGQVKDEDGPPIVVGG